MTKEELRNKYKKIRDSIENRKEKSLVIINKVLEDDDYIKSKTIGIYISFGSEVDTDLLIRNSILEKEICVPVIINKEMIFSKIESDTKYTNNKYGILEPNKLKPINKIDLLIIPGICFDKDKNRIGFGGGYYDRYLNNQDIKTIAICFEEQITEHIPNEKHDVKVKKIITDKSIY